MASRRQLKKVINYVLLDLYTETIYSSLVSKADSEVWMELINKILKLKADYISRISHIEPGVKPSVYFAEVKRTFAEKANAIASEIEPGI